MNSAQSYYFFLLCSGLDNVEDIDNYCSIPGLHGEIGKFIEDILHTDIQYPEGAYDSNGHIIRPVLELADDYIWVAIKWVDRVVFGTDLHDLSKQFKSLIKIFSDLSQVTISRILYDQDWLRGFNNNGQLCKQLGCGNH